MSTDRPSLRGLAQDVLDRRSSHAEVPMLLFTTLLPAHAIPAEGDAACALATLAQSAPAHGSTGVPTDVSLLLTFSGSCGIDAPYSVRLARTGEATAILAQTFDFDAFTSLAGGVLLEVDLPDLDPTTSYDVVVGGQFSEPQAFSFTTGAGPLGPVAGVPGAELLDATRSGDADQGWFVVADIAFTPAGAGGSAFVIRSGGQELAVVAEGATGPFDGTASWWTWESDTGRELCITVAERTANGAWLGPSEESCISTTTDPSGGGCASAPAVPLLLGVLAVPLALGRRRR